MKNKIFISICCLLALFLSIAVYRQYVESNIIFHSFYEPAKIKVGTKLEKTPIEFYHTQNIDKKKITYEYIYDKNIINEVQTMTVKVHYQFFTFTNSYELLIIE